ncbi:ISAs1 family transposase [Micromonospora sp. H33]|uniref:ISAs1 family transposase n=1 Tax=Micromonospora sp. H33 TaxID=3452215 RepID=UPI003F8B2EC4
MPALLSSLISSVSRAPALAVSEAAGGLLAALADLPDPRARRGVRHRLTVVVSAAVCAVVAGNRSYTAIAEWIADVPAATALALGMASDRRPSEAMIRRLLQAIDPQLLTAAVSVWLTGRAAAGTSTSRRAIAVDGKTLRGSRTTDAAARHVMAACDQAVGVILASTDVDGKTNEITRFQPLLDQIGDLRDTVITADALHCQREHVDYLAERGAHWILTVKGNQPSLHSQLAGLPWRAVPDATRDTDRGHGRREIRTLKVLTLSTGIDFPHAAQALQIRRRRRRLDQPKRFTTETVYAITDLRVHQAKPAQLATWIRGHWSIENKIHWVRDVTYDEDRCQIRTGTGPEVMAALRNAAIGALRTAGIANIAAANRHHARDSTRPLALLGIT